MLEFFLYSMVNSDKLHELPPKEKQKVVAQAHANTQLMKHKKFKKAFWAGLILILLATITVGIYFQALKPAVSCFVVSTALLWYILARIAKPYVYANLPDEYQ